MYHQDCSCIDFKPNWLFRRDCSHWHPYYRASGLESVRTYCYGSYHLDTDRAYSLYPDYFVNNDELLLSLNYSRIILPIFGRVLPD